MATQAQYSTLETATSTSAYKVLILGRNACSTLLIMDAQNVKNADTAEVTDRQGSLQAFQRWGQVQSVLTDGGYTGEAFAQRVRKIFRE